MNLETMLNNLKKSVDDFNFADMLKGGEGLNESSQMALNISDRAYVLQNGETYVTVQNILEHVRVLNENVKDDEFDCIFFKESIQLFYYFFIDIIKYISSQYYLFLVS